MERAAVATFKHAPHSPKGALQWYARMLDLGGGQVPQSKGKGAARELDDGYHALQTSDVAAIKSKYGATHMLAHRNTTHPFPRVHEDDDWVLYDLCCEEPSMD
jgi:hypothetical protein